MTSNRSLEELEEQYSETKNESLTDLEDSYQEYKVLGSNEDFSAKITDACVDENVYLELSLTNGSKIVVNIERNPDGLKNLYRIFEAVGQSLQADLHLLIGESVNVQFESEQMEHIFIGDKREVKLEVVDSPKNLDLNNESTLPNEIVAATKRRVRYDEEEDEILRCDVISAYPEDEKLILEFDLLGETASWSTSVPDGQNMSGSTFESVVEKVGHGSVQQVVEGEVYITDKNNISVSLVEAPNIIGKFEEWKSTWVIFGTRSDAEKCQELEMTSAAAETSEQTDQSSSTQAEHDVSHKKAQAFLDEVQPGENIRYVGRGSNIEIERGGDTETVTSLSGFERIAITSDRVILKSSQVTGDVCYKLSYDELQGADLKTGIINKKISLRTGYGTYHIKISDPDKESCRDMVDFVKEKVR
jgi:hypothetical protein